MDFDKLKEGYDQVAEEYIARIFHELEHKPLDRDLLDRLAADAHTRGPICDMGCGPGHVARYLHERGAQVLGIDLSPRMIELARQMTPGVEFRLGNMLALDVDDAAWAGIVAFYSIIHIPRDNVVGALRELRRALKPGGLLLLAFHIGQEIRHLDEWWGKQVSVDFLFFERAEMEGYLQAADFAIEQSIEREPYEGVEVATRRAYIFARKPHHSEVRDER
jgi:SAM-dependent methyltransferase